MEVHNFIIQKTTIKTVTMVKTKNLTNFSWNADFWTLLKCSVTRCWINLFFGYLMMAYQLLWLHGIFKYLIAVYLWWKIYQYCKITPQTFLDDRTHVKFRTPSNTNERYWLPSSPIILSMGQSALHRNSNFPHVRFFFLLFFVTHDYTSTWLENHIMLY